MAYGGILGKSTTTWTNSQIMSTDTAGLFGLSADAVPDDMLNALAHTGDLHVWKRTADGVVDYPVSPDRNAYQEVGPKPSGYTLGPVTSGNFGIGQDSITFAVEISVSDNGLVSLSGGTQSLRFTGNGGAQTAQVNLPGKFVLFQASHSPFNANTIYFIPTDATFTYSGLTVYVNKYQTVTGYPAIPTNITIEYMGQVGDKTKISTGSFTPLTPGPLFVDVGFTPSLVIGYMMDNNANGYTASQNSMSMQSQYIPRILSKAYPSNLIVENGFNWYSATQTSKVYYVAFL